MINTFIMNVYPYTYYNRHFLYIWGEYFHDPGGEIEAEEWILQQN